MPKSTDTDRQAERKKNAVWGAVLSTVFRLTSAAVLLWLRQGMVPGGFGSRLMLVIALLDLGTVIPIWILLKTRLKEIQGGEEDVASQY